MSQLERVCGRCGTPVPTARLYALSPSYGSTTEGCRECASGWKTDAERLDDLERRVALLERERETV